MGGGIRTGSAVEAKCLLRAGAGSVGGRGEPLLGATVDEPGGLAADEVEDVPEPDDPRLVQLGAFVHFPCRFRNRISAEVTGI